MKPLGVISCLNAIRHYYHNFDEKNRHDGHESDEPIPLGPQRTEDQRHKNQAGVPAEPFRDQDETVSSVIDTHAPLKIGAADELPRECADP